MKIVVCNDYRDVSKAAARLMTEQLSAKPDSILGLATGSTPLGMYEQLISEYLAGRVDFARCTTFNLDEYCGLPKSDPNSFYSFMQANLFSKVNILAENIHIPNGENPDARQEVAHYEELINTMGGIDFQVLGMGRNGHIGFNEPAGQLEDKTHQVRLTKDTIYANSRFFASPDQVPKQAYTMGVGTIMRAKKIMMLVSGENKADAVAGMLSGKITTSNPASLLQLHPDVTLIADKAACPGEYGRVRVYDTVQLCNL